MGDVVRGIMRAHKAAEEGLVVVENILGRKRTVNYDTLPIVVHSDPAVGFVGETEDALKKSGKFHAREIDS